MKKYRFIVKTQVGNYIISVQENLTAAEVDEKVKWFIDNGYYQMADYKVEIMQTIYYKSIIIILGGTNEKQKRYYKNN